jgi:photosystem II stability/assembly factor-like uncharacterized protein
MQASGTNRNFSDISFVDASTGWAVGQIGTIATTTDGGLTWTFQESGTTAGLYDLIFVDSQVGWIVGREGMILKTLTGGANE